MARPMGTILLLACVCLGNQVLGNSTEEQQEITLKREEIFVKIDNGATFSLMMEPDDTVSDLKQDLYGYEGVPGEHKQFYLGDTKLLWYNKLSFYGIKAGTTITMISTEDVSNYTIELTVRTRDGQDLPFKTQLDNLVSSLKNNITQRIGLAPEDQRLLLRGKEVRDERKLMDYNFCHGTQVQLGEPLENFRQAVEIQVKTPSGVTFKVEISLADTVDSLKNKIFDKTGVPTGVQWLFANERSIWGQDHLCDLGLEVNSTVFMYLRSSRITSLAEVARLQEFAGESAHKAPIFREVDDASEPRRRASIFKDTRNWVRGPRPDWVPEMFDPVAKLMPNPDSEYWITYHLAELERSVGANASEHQRMEAEFVRAQIRLSTTVRPYRVAAKLNSVNKPRQEPGIILGGGSIEASPGGHPIPLGADVNNWAPDAFSDADLMRLFELSERVRQLLAKSARTGEGLLSIASQRRINHAILLTYQQALAGYAPLVESNQASEGGTCAICQDDLAAEPATKLPCEHVFHADCIHSWMAKLFEQRHAPSCPFCRQRFMFPYAIQGKDELRQMDQSE